MSKGTGLSSSFFMSGYDLSGDIASADEISGSVNPLILTSIDKSAQERIGGLRDGKMNVTSYYDPAANQSHSQFSMLPTTDMVASFVIGAGIGLASVSEMAKMVDYKPSRKADGMYTFQVPHVANGFAQEWGDQLTPGKTTISGAGAQTSFDYGATVGATSFGLSAYLHVFAFSGTSVTVAIQDSPDNVTFTNVTGGVFTSATGITAQRIATANNLTVNRYLRVNATGTFTSATFFVQVQKFLTLSVY